LHLNLWIFEFLVAKRSALK